MQVAVVHHSRSLRALVASPHRGLVEGATLASLYGVYELIRGGGHTRLAGARAHAETIVSLERHLHIFGEGALQHAALAVPVLPPVLGAAYITLHFVGTIAFLLWLYRRHRDRFALVRNTLVGGTAIALAIFVAFPVAPPRLSGNGFIDTVSDSAHLNLSSHLLGSVYNPFAAVPSLHFGYALIVGVTVASLAPRRAVRLLGAVYPIVMLLVIVATGNHFFLDAATAAAVMAGAYAVSRALVAWNVDQSWRARSALAAPESQPRFHCAA